MLHFLIEDHRSDLLVVTLRPGFRPASGLLSLGRQLYTLYLASTFPTYGDSTNSTSSTSRSEFCRLLLLK